MFGMATTNFKCGCHTWTRCTQTMRSDTLDIFI
jgi:hypothetical protein